MYYGYCIIVSIDIIFRGSVSRIFKEQRNVGISFKKIQHGQFVRFHFAAFFEKYTIKRVNVSSGGSVL